MERTGLVQAVYQLARRAIREGWLFPYNPERALIFEQRMGYPLPQDLTEWLQVCNGGLCVGGGVLAGLHAPQAEGPCDDILELTEGLHTAYKGLEDAPDVVEKRWAAVAHDECGNYYVLTCVPDGHGCTPVYFWDQDMSYYIVASDLWHFLYGFLADSEHYYLHRDDPHRSSFWWPFDREQTLAFDPALRVYEGRGLLPWE
ncbi:MAG: SMI1/KNR4 family protein [Fimbriimonadales bacterium]|nr:SMI1/KNR4 family protein [Fimbriimonadales bacterium]